MLYSMGPSWGALLILIFNVYIYIYIILCCDFLRDDIFYCFFIIVWATTVELFIVLCCISYATVPSSCYRSLGVVLSVLTVVSCRSNVVDFVKSK
jgi:hypothetical protein